MDFQNGVKNIQAAGAQMAILTLLCLSVCKSRQKRATLKKSYLNLETHVRLGYLSKRNIMNVGEYGLVFLLTRVNCGKMQLDIQIRHIIG